LTEVKTRDDYPELIAGLPETDVARLAAFIDGEGCIFVGQRNKLTGRMKTPQYSLSLVITNTHVEFINWLKDTFDGSVYFVKYEKCKHLGKKQIMRWQVNERMAAIILERCLPYMLIKREQARLGLVFMETKKPKTHFIRRADGTIYPIQLNNRDIEKRAELKAEISRLNQSGGAVVN
jgi:hypothetical protein